MSEATIDLKAVYDLIRDDQGEIAEYRIPNYQRGYRWTPEQVTQLLDDIWEFASPKNGESRGDFYCLQPLVIGADGRDSYEVVDGQQRLTTILLILEYFNEGKSEKRKQTHYKITFETRKSFQKFLENPSEESAKENIDFHHIHKAMQAIEKWFEDKDRYVNDIESALLNKTKVIWFQLSDGDDPVAAFTRLNVGKIPLTDDELIRALFLKKEKSGGKEDEERKLRLAYEWDLLEKALQADPFWLFLQSDKSWKDNRVRFLFQLRGRIETSSDQLPYQDSPHQLFLVWQDILLSKAKSKDSDPAGSVWKEIRSTFRTLEEWYEDRRLFHAIGYLIHQGVKLTMLLDLLHGNTKDEFSEALRKELYRKSIGGKLPDFQDKAEVEKLVSEKLNELHYQRDRIRIKSILLLFNLASLNLSEKSNQRFQFDEFKREDWDIEHVRSVADDPPETKAERQEFLEDVLAYLKTRDDKVLSAKIKQFLEAQANADSVEEISESFDLIYREVLKITGEETGRESETDHGIGNLTLLDYSTNRSYGNAMFPLKRLRVLGLDEEGRFVPPCTRNVFLKCYNPKIDNLLRWGPEDRDAYQQEMLRVLTKFFTTPTAIQG